MVSMDIEELAIASWAVFDEFSDPGDGRGAGTGDTGHFTVTETFAELPRDFQTLAPRLQFTERPDIAQEVANVFFALAGKQRAAERLEPRLSLVAVFGEALTSGHTGTLYHCSATMSSIFVGVNLRYTARVGGSMRIVSRG